MRMIVTGRMSVLLTVGVLLVAHTPTASAQVPASGALRRAAPVPEPAAAPAWVTNLRGQLGASINNPGAQLAFEVSRLRPLSRSRHLLLADAHVGMGGTAAFTPANVGGGVWAEVAPLSVFVVRVGAEPAFYFGTFHTLSSFSSRSDPFDTDSLRQRDSAATATTTRVYVTPTIRLRARRLVGLASADVEWWSSTAAGPFFYAPSRDTLLDVSGDWLTTVTSAVLYEHPLASGRLSTGITHSRMRSRAGSLNQVQRLGVVISRQSTGHLFAFRAPTITLSAARYLDHPSKQGQWTAVMAIGFALRR